MSIASYSNKWRHRLPHWEMEDRWHFITVRCQGSLPDSVADKIWRIRMELNKHTGCDETNAILQRQYFLTTEKYLEKGEGYTPFVDPKLCHLCMNALHALEADGWKIQEATIMPNHVHLLIHRNHSKFDLKQAIMRLKGRSTQQINKFLGRSGRFWQEDWFDRWMRNENEFLKTIDYIRKNPVKANMVKNWETHQWRISKNYPFCKDKF